ncbi:MAG: sigma-70 family RNA polymerase sigma factor, partial [Planctomycetes bacterium]|nr:sigma-70 family RNA polymerase sigma factor [Planctomycetota bacterium]
MVTPDAVLLERWREDRDGDAFREIVARHARMVHSTCRRVLDDDEEACDVSQDCFLRLAQEPPTIRSSLGGFLHRLAHRSALNRRVQVERRRNRESRAARVERGDPDRTWAEIRLHVDAAIEALPESLREIVVARYLEQESIEDIGQRLGLSRRRVSYRLRKGIERIRRRMQRHGLGVTSALITAYFTSEANSATPKVLLAELGRRALAGGPEVVVPLGDLSIGWSMRWFGGGLAVKKLAWGIAILSLALLGATL